MGARLVFFLFRFLFFPLIPSAPTFRPTRPARLTPTPARPNAHELSFRAQRGTCCCFFFQLVTRLPAVAGHSPLATSPSSFTSHEHRIRSAGIGRAEFIPARSGARLFRIFLFVCPFPRLLFPRLCP